MLFFEIIIYTLFGAMCIWFVISGVRKINQIRASQALSEFYTDEEEHNQAIKDAEEFEKEPAVFSSRKLCSLFFFEKPPCCRKHPDLYRKRTCKQHVFLECSWRSFQLFHKGFHFDFRLRQSPRNHL